MYCDYIRIYTCMNVCTYVACIRYDFDLAAAATMSRLSVCVRSREGRVRRRRRRRFTTARSGEGPAVPPSTCSPPGDAFAAFRRTDDRPLDRRRRPDDALKATTSLNRRKTPSFYYFPVLILVQQGRIRGGGESRQGRS